MSKQRIHLVKSDFGLGDYYNFHKKKYNSNLSKKEFRNIIDDFFKGLTDLIIEDEISSYKIPYINMEILLKKQKVRPRLKDGKLINNVPVDWKSTNELWERDKEAKEKKLLVRYNNYHTSGYIFRIYCKKFNCRIPYKHLYKFSANRSFARRLSKRLLDNDKDNLNAYLLY